MYTTWNYSLVGSNKKAAGKAVDAAVFEINRLDNLLAMWKKNSEVYKHNRFKTEPTSPELKECLAIARDVFIKTGGAFDPHVAALVRLWYKALKEKHLPNQSDITAALNNKTQMDFGALAKGYAQDRVALIFKAAGFEDFLINAGGQVYAAGQKPNGSAWKIGIQHPREPDQIITIIPLKNQAMATSGDYEQVTLIDGKRYPHIIDPTDGWPAKKGVASSTVIVSLDHSKYPAALADALATAGLVMGADLAKNLLEKEKLKGLWITEFAPQELESLMTDNLNHQLELAF